MDLRDYILDVPGFPRPGIVFKDITPLLSSPEAFSFAVDAMVSEFSGLGVTKVCGVESRGFIFGGCVALRLGVGFVPVRKPGKLPRKVVSADYELEYGTDTVQMHEDAVDSGDKVLMVDDLLATGGTMDAACRLVEQCGGEIVGCAFVVELDFLKGRERLKGRRILSLVHYEGE